MKRIKLLIQNLIIYGLGGAISKLIPFIMLPIITRLMPDSFYMGISDNFTVIVSLGATLAGAGMYDAMFRMFFEKEEDNYKKAICSSSLFFVTSFSLIIICIFAVFHRIVASSLFPLTANSTELIVFSALNIMILAISNIVSAPTRMQNKRKVYLFTNFLSPVISYMVSLILIVKYNWYEMALPTGSLLSAFLLLVVFFLLNRYWFNLKLVDKKIIFQMLKISLPLVPGAMIYWVFNSADRIMITEMLGAEYNGIYSVGAKFGHISNLIYLAFAGGWQYFAFSTMREKDQVEMTSNIFEYISIITYLTGIFITVFYDTLFSFLFTGEYLAGSIVVPYLFLSPLILIMYQIAANQLLVIKETMPGTIILLIGALTNILINYLLIQSIGIEGAAIGTLLGYAVTDFLSIIYLTWKKLLKLSSHFYISTFFFVIYFVCWRLVFIYRYRGCYALIFLFLIIFVYLNKIKADIKSLIKNKMD